MKGSGEQEGVNLLGIVGAPEWASSLWESGPEAPLGFQAKGQRSEAEPPRPPGSGCSISGLQEKGGERAPTPTRAASFLQGG